MFIIWDFTKNHVHCEISPMLTLKICETLQMILGSNQSFWRMSACPLLFDHKASTFWHSCTVNPIQSTVLHPSEMVFFSHHHLKLTCLRISLKILQSLKKNLWVCQLLFDHKVSCAMSLFPLMTLRHSDSAHSSPLLPPLQLLLLLLVLLLLVLLLLLPFSWPQCAGTIRVWRTSQPRLPGGLS